MSDELEALFSDAALKAKTDNDFKLIKFVSNFVTDSFFDIERDLEDVKFWFSKIGEKNDK